MAAAPATPGVVAACAVEGRAERLDRALAQLEACEKALQVGGGIGWRAWMAELYWGLQVLWLGWAGLLRCFRLQEGALVSQIK